MTIRGFSLWQPWASLVALGVKTIETRSWSTKYRGPLMIHAAKRPPEVGQWLGSWCVSQHRNGRAIHSYPPPRETPAWYLLPLGAFVATCDLVDVVPILDANVMLDIEWQKHVAPTKGGDQHLWLWLGPSDTENASTGRPTWLHHDIESERPFGDFTPGRYAWVLDNVRRIDPIPATGHQGLWKVHGWGRCRECDALIYQTEGGLWVTGPAEADDVCVLEVDGSTWAHEPVAA